MGYLPSETFTNKDVWKEESTNVSGDTGYLPSETFTNMEVCDESPGMGSRRVSERRYPVSPRVNATYLI